MTTGKNKSGFEQFYHTSAIAFDAQQEIHKSSTETSYHTKYLTGGPMTDHRTLNNYDRLTDPNMKRGVAIDWCNFLTRTQRCGFSNAGEKFQ